ncbi:MAG: amidase [Geminicoccaceae bacterium]|nr:amidase [Geminicoccaceae bacterium]
MNPIPDSDDPFTVLAPPRPCRTGPLAGVGLAVKETIAVAGLPWHGGSKALEGRIARADAPAVADLRGAGVGVVGLTRCDTLGFGVTTPTLRHPSAPGRSVGGSSGGAAAAVLLGRAALGLGTDTGGSCRIPAACCGLFGLKPSRGLVPLAGMMPMAPGLDHAGFIAARLPLIRRALAVFDAKGAAPHPRLAVDREALAAAEPSVRDALDAALARLVAAGHRLCPVRLPGEPLWRAAHGVIVCRAALEVWGRTRRDGLPPRLLAALDRGAALKPRDAALALKAQTACTAAVDGLFERADLLLLPTLAVPPPPQRANVVPVGGHRRDVVAALTLYTGLFNLTGHPALAVPVAHPGTPLPASLQIVAPLGADLALVDAVRGLLPLLDPDGPDPDEDGGPFHAKAGGA